MIKKIKYISIATLAMISAVAGVGATVNFAHDGVSENYYVDALTTAQTKTVQTKLKQWGYYKGAVDGIFGPKTKEAVKYFQRKNGLTVDGIVGKKTAAAMGISLSSSGSSTTSQSSSKFSNQISLSTPCKMIGL